MASPSERTPRRKLTTVLIADAQSYSHLMEVDEEGTLATLKHYRTAMKRLIESHEGRVINTWGDELLAEFASVVEAVRAAVDIQTDLAQRNAARPAETRMLFRIGINLDDIIADGDDIYGDGVNVAARLQATAPPGGIVISSTVYDQVRNKVTVGFQFLGDLTVKNIDHEIPSYEVLIGENSRAAHPAHRPGDAHGHTSGKTRGKTGRGRRLRPKLATYAVVAGFFIVVNLVSGWHGFWAGWPVLLIAVLAGITWARSLSPPKRRHAILLVVAACFVGANALSWDGRPWAVWPLLIIGLMAALDWARHLGSRRL